MEIEKIRKTITSLFSEKIVSEGIVWEFARNP
jgi:hypothetical protein